jgi:outer membrane lipoprotein LolB
MKRRQWLAACTRASSALTIISIAGCAVNMPGSGTKASEAAFFQPRDRYAGRLSLVIDAAPGSSEQQQSFSGSFELRGNSDVGELDLLTPLGQIVVQLRWTPSAAVILRGSQRESFSDVGDLIRRATGASISLQQLFAWLDGKPSASSGDDWQVDLSSHANGRIIARRNQPTPAVLRIALEQP